MKSWEPFNYAGEDLNRKNQPPLTAEAATELGLSDEEEQLLSDARRDSAVFLGVVLAAVVVGAVVGVIWWG